MYNLADTSFIVFFSKIFQNHQWICSFFYCILRPHMTLITEPRTIISSVKVKCGPNYTCVQLPFPLISLTASFACICDWRVPHGTTCTDEKSVFMLWLHRCWALEHAIIFNMFYQRQAMGTVHLALWKDLKPSQRAAVQIVKLS